MFYISQKAKTVKKVSPSQNLGLPIFGPRTAEVKEVKEEKDRPWVVQNATKIMWEFVLWFEGFHRRRKSKKLEQSCWFESMLCFLRVKKKWPYPWLDFKPFYKKVGVFGSTPKKQSVPGELKMWACPNWDYEDLEDFCQTFWNACRNRWVSVLLSCCPLPLRWGFFQLDYCTDLCVGVFQSQDAIVRDSHPKSEAESHGFLLKLIMLLVEIWKW